jgi:hypothetical protein
MRKFQAKGTQILNLLSQTKYFLVLIGYLAFVSSKGTHNSDNFVMWISDFLNGNFFPLYHTVPYQGVLASESLMVPYPPLSLYILGVVAKVIVFFAGDSSNAILIATNLTSIIFTFMTAALLAFLGRTNSIMSPVLYLLTPVVFLISPILGYQDSIMSFFVLAAFIAAEKKSWALSAAMAAMAILTKQLAVMPIFGLGLIVLLTLQWRIIIRFTITFLLISATILSPFILTGTLPAYFRAQGLASVHTMMSAQNPNVPWLIGQISRIIDHGIFNVESYSALPLRIVNDTLRQFLYLSFGAFSALFILFWFFYWMKKLDGFQISPIFAGALAISSYNLFSFGVHENHAFMLMPILFAVVGNRQNRKIYVLASTALAINLIATSGLGRSLPSVPVLIYESGFLYSLVSIICLVLYTLALWELWKTRPTLQPLPGKNHPLL